MLHIISSYDGKEKGIAEILEENSDLIDKNNELMSVLNSVKKSLENIVDEFEDDECCGDCDCCGCDCDCDEDVKDNTIISDNEPEVVADCFVINIINEFVEGSDGNDIEYSREYRKALSYLRSYAKYVLDFVDGIEC